MINLISQQVRTGAETEDQGCLKILPVIIGDQVSTGIISHTGHWLKLRNMSRTNLLIVKQSGINNPLIDWLNDKFWKWGTWLRRVFLGVAVGGAMLIATRTIERAVNGKDGSPGAPPEWQAKQIETLPVETLKGIGSVLEGIGDRVEKEGLCVSLTDSEEKEGDAEEPRDCGNTIEWSKVEWTEPEGPYNPDCPIGNYYCKHGYGEGAGWMCWKWLEKYQNEMRRLYEEARMVNDDWAQMVGEPEEFVRMLLPVGGDPTPDPEVLTEMLSQHETALNEMFNLGGKEVDVNFFQDETEEKEGTECGCAECTVRLVRNHGTFLLA